MSGASTATAPVIEGIGDRPHIPVPLPVGAEIDNLSTALIDDIAGKTIDLGDYALDKEQSINQDSPYAITTLSRDFPGRVSSM